MNRLGLSFSLAFLVVQAGTALASETVGDLLNKADRGAGVKSDTKKGQTSLPTFTGSLFDQSQKTGSVKQENLGDIRPPRSSVIMQDPNDDKAKLEMITDEQIQELYKLTRKYRSSPNRGELWLRLAELYVEKASFVDLRKQAEYDQKLKVYQDGKTKIKPLLDLADAHEYNKKAIELYDWFSRDFPKDPKMDQALFFLGYNNYELNDTKKGTYYYTRLTKEYPRSPYVVESNFALAEFYFESEKWKTALGYYLEVVKQKRSRLYTFALYKSAWCYYRSGNSHLALSTMEGLIREGRAGASGEKRAGGHVKLEAEGLRDIVLFYSDVGEPAKAPKYFQALMGNDANTYVEKLAYYYIDKGNREGAKVLFRYLTSIDPNSPKAFDYKYQVVKAYSNANKTHEFREELYSWIHDYGMSSTWYAANKSKTELISSSDKLREQTLRTWVLQQHQTAQNSRAPFVQGLANEGYKLYLAEVPKSTVNADMHFYYGELLYDMDKFEEAGAQYKWVVDNGSSSKYFGRAAENTVLSLEKNLPKDSEIERKVGKGVDPVPLEPRVDKFVQTAIWYTQKFPKGTKTVELKFRIGRLFYMHNQFDQAIPYFKEIVQDYPKTRYAEYSANLLLDIFNLKKDLTGLEKMGKELLAIPAIANSSGGKDIKNVLERANFKRAQDLEVAKDYGKSAEGFQSFAQANPHSDLASTAMFNAAINYERAGQPGKAMEMHGAVLAATDKKAEGYKVKSRRIVAKLYQDSGKLEEAARAYHDSAVEAGNDPLAPNLFYNAAIINEALGHTNVAIQNYDAFYQKSRKNDRNDALYAMATLYRKNNQNQAAAMKYKDFLNVGGTQPEKNVESAYWLYKLETKMNHRKEIDEWKHKTLNMQARYAPEKKGVGAKYAAKIKFDEVQETFNDFLRVHLNSVKKLKQQADEKIAFLTKLNSQLSQVLKYDSPEEIVGVLSLLGQANLNMGEAFTGAPLPGELKTADEISQYKAGVQKIADPFYAKAKDSLKTAVDRGQEFEAYTEEYQKARSLMVKLDHNSFYDGGQISLPVRQSNWMGL